ncbi:MAG TPA: hypothetical protein VFD39_03510 [Trueperaceae bacterium]|nr:hypothetical protein [Trueperaceae bacterium]
MSDNSLSNADLTALVYRSLIRDTLLPSDPLVVGRAALGAIEGGGTELPAGFGDDVERDALWLASRLPVDGPPWASLGAMATAADKPHTNVSHEFAIGRVGAVWNGKPRTSPGLGMVAADRRRTRSGARGRRGIGSGLWPASR